MMTVVVWNLSNINPVSVKHRFNWHGTTPFIAVKLKIPSVASIITIHSNASLVRDFECRIVIQLVKRAVLKQKRKIVKKKKKKKKKNKTKKKKKKKKKRKKKKKKQKFFF